MSDRNSPGWYVDEHGVTRRRSQVASKFGAVFLVLNLAAILAMLGVMIWAFFDIHNRLPFVMFAQIPPIVMLVIRRMFR